MSSQRSSVPETETPTKPAGRETAEAETAGEEAPGGRRRPAALVAPAVMLLLVAAAAALPLLRNTIFYFWDDTAGAVVPVWRRIAESVLDGRLPLLEPDMWRGGGFAAEASTGIVNPVVVALAVATYWFDNMALAITVAKVFFLLVLAAGTYLAAREYGVRPGIAAAAGTAIPLAGQTFFWDATSWTYSLMATAFVPWVLWALRRAAHRDGSLLWVVVAGYLCCSLGNPYGLAATGVLVLAFVIEAWLAGRRGRAVGIAAAGVAVACLVVIVYLPLVLTSPVGFRSEARTLNDEFLSPSVTDLLGMSTPINQPFVNTWGLPYLSVPALYLAWFVLPLVPWLRWRILRERGRSLAGLLIFGGVFTLLLLGPSQLWMFRWPLRLVTFVWFPVILLWAILASAGLERTKVGARAAASAGLIFLGGYLAWADIPDDLDRIAAGAALVAGLVALALVLGVRGRPMAPALIAGTVLVLGLQLYFYPSMGAGANYQFPTSQQVLRERFAKYHGTTVQIADLAEVDAADFNPDRAYRDMLFGSMYGVAGVESPSAYSGIGYTKLDSALCMVYQGSVCARAWDRLWQPVPGYDVPLADLLRAETVVVQNALVDTRRGPAPAGWRRARDAEATGLVTVWRRIDPLPWPDGRVADAPPGVRVVDDRATNTTDERIAFTSDGAPGRLTFARLNWPDYAATVNGVPVATGTNDVGLLVVELPAGVTAGTVELTWRVPGGTLAAATAGAGALITLVITVLPAILRRRANNQESHRQDTKDRG